MVRFYIIVERFVENSRFMDSNGREWVTIKNKKRKTIVLLAYFCVPRILHSRLSLIDRSLNYSGLDFELESILRGKRKQGKTSSFYVTFNEHIYRFLLFELKFRFYSQLYFIKRFFFFLRIRLKIESAEGVYGLTEGRGEKEKRS